VLLAVCSFKSLFPRCPTSDQRKIQGDSIREVSASASAECRKAMNDISTIALMMMDHARFVVDYSERLHYISIYC
jgi:hypothetical protein